MNNLANLKSTQIGRLPAAVAIAAVIASMASPLAAAEVSNAHAGKLVIAAAAAFTAAMWWHRLGPVKPQDDPAPPLRHRIPTR